MQRINTQRMKRETSTLFLLLAFCGLSMLSLPPQFVMGPFSSISSLILLSSVYMDDHSGYYSLQLKNPKADLCHRRIYDGQQHFQCGTFSAGQNPCFQGQKQEAEPPLLSEPHIPDLSVTNASTHVCFCSVFNLCIRPKIDSVIDSSLSGA